VAAPFFLERAWIPKRPGLRAVRIRPGAPSGFEGSLGRPDLLVSAGFCGGLDPRLKTGDLILASEVYHRGRKIAGSRSTPGSLPGLELPSALIGSIRRSAGW